MKTLIPKSFIQDVIAKTDIISVVQSRIELKKRGNTYTACCPFHNEKTPSFSVSDAKQFYYCFGCGAHGDVIKFLMDYDHLTFIDAITDLAQKLGLAIPQETSNTPSEDFSELYAVMRHAQSCYEAELRKSDTAISYLKNRGLSGQVAKEFGIGFAPNAWEFLSKPLAQKKEALILSGMAIEKKNDGSHTYDRFRDRIMFPIRDVRGHTIGFGGRTLTNETPKYLNSPETPIFHKQQTLYGLYEICHRQHNKLQRALIVEGYLDVISLAQNGIGYAVATLGTAFNIKHIQLLLRYTNEIIFCFDGDNAGRKAAWKAITISLPLLRDGVNIRVLFLPKEDDPDSLVRKIGKEAFEQLIANADALSTVFFGELEKEFPLNDIATKAAFGKNASEHLSKMPEGIYKNLLLDELAKRLQLQREKITPATTPAQNPEKQVIKSSRPILSERLTLTQKAIQLLLHQPEFAKHATTPTHNPYDSSLDYFLLCELLARFTENPQLTMSDLLTLFENPAHRALIATIAAYPLHISPEGRAAEFNDAIERINQQNQANELSALIEKAKNNPLTAHEKERLQQLLMLTKKSSA